MSKKSEEVEVVEEPAEDLGHYPSFRYHKTKKPKIVHSKKDDEKLGKDWATTPAAFKPEDEEEKAD